MASLSKVDIANLALSNLGTKSSIEGFFPDERTTEAKRAAQWYEPARLQVLEAYNWNFARKRAELAEHGDDPPEEWAYRYQYPADCVAFRHIWNPAGPTAKAVPFTLETSGGSKSILTDLEDAIGVYTYDLQDTSLFSMHFNMTLSYLMSHYMAMSITGKRTIKQDMLVQYNAMILQAPAQDANETVEREPRDADWIAGRG